MIAFILDKWLSDLGITDKEFITASGYSGHTVCAWLIGLHIPQPVHLRDIIQTFARFGNWSEFAQYLALRDLSELRLIELRMRKHNKGVL
jgi:hypothetical protein